ncbi:MULTISPECIES: HAD-IA family hydrolase [unclassified Streptomyces]|uniref:HAD-IA family hydrolase n=1 Tax=unclassified Streptomyces TaxID=2593676 RepID=UPI002DDAB2D0|nr:HAD-IA family hydrolase [Streptomyces sp. NBC_01788]WSB30804.1 HAD-IA family hydrolase [Streptomyces sp. NBC_01788]
MTLGAVLFDVDEVLLDSTEAHRRVWGAWAGLRGLNASAVWPLTFGRRPEDTVRLTAPELDPSQERLVLDQLLDQQQDAFPAVHGAVELLLALPVDAWAIVTSGDRGSVHARFAAAGLPLPRVQVYGGDVVQAKPAPECYLKAAAALGLEPSACLVVEDAPVGVAAGKAAGCRVAGFTSTHDRADLRPADLLFDTHADTAAYLEAAGLLSTGPSA